MYFYRKYQYCLKFIFCLLCTLFRRKSRTKYMPNSLSTPQNQTVQEAEKYLCENFMNESLNREVIAAHLKISCAYLSEIFKKNTQKTLPQYLNELRISKAKELLQNTHNRVTEIAYEVGFRNFDHFIRVFKSFERVTPTEFRGKCIKAMKGR
ncbi:MAG TPA: hypothetical protein DDY34_15985 [Bacteroidales bacterium]|nr:hypothetical protein [Bacteroidales bacterium]